MYILLIRIPLLNPLKGLINVTVPVKFVDSAFSSICQTLLTFIVCFGWYCKDRELIYETVPYFLFFSYHDAYICLPFGGVVSVLNAST